MIDSNATGTSPLSFRSSTGSSGPITCPPIGRRRDSESMIPFRAPISEISAIRCFLGTSPATTREDRSSRHDDRRQPHSPPPRREGRPANVALRPPSAQVAYRRSEISSATRIVVHGSPSPDLRDTIPVDEHPLRREAFHYLQRMLLTAAEDDEVRVAQAKDAPVVERRRIGTSPTDAPAVSENEVEVRVRDLLRIAGAQTTVESYTAIRKRRKRVLRPAEIRNDFPVQIVLRKILDRIDGIRCLADP